MFSFLKFLNSHHTRQWIFLCFVLLSVVDHSGAQGIRDEYLYDGYFPPWPACATDCGLPAALNSSTLQLCTSAFIGACMRITAFVHIPTFCSIVTSSPCPVNQCIIPFEPESLLSWVNSVCNLSVSEQALWNVSTSYRLSHWIQGLFPWNWTVQAPAQPATLAIEIQLTALTSSDPYLTVPPSIPGDCSTSTAAKLGVFAAVNIISAMLLPILGRRTVVKKLTFGYFGNLGSRWWPLMGVLSAALNLFGNLLNAIMIRSTPGYENVPVGALTLLWCTRPRLAWLAVFLASFESEEGMYFNCAASAIMSEAILQVLGAVYFGISANYAREKGFYRTGQLDPYPRGVEAHVMYAGALLWLIMSFVTLWACVICMIGLGKVIKNAQKMMRGLQNAVAASGYAVAGSLGRQANANSSGPWANDSYLWDPELSPQTFDGQEGDSIKPEPRKLTEAEIKRLEATGIAWMIFVSFVAQWLFWAGFVQAAQERYCPPNLAILGAIWSLFAASGTFVGSTH